MDIYHTKKIATHRIEKDEKVVIWYDFVAGHYWVTPDREYRRQQRVKKEVATKVMGHG